MYSPNIDGAEISWFAPLCDGDDDFLGNRNPITKAAGITPQKLLKQQIGWDIKMYYVLLPIK